MRPTSALQTYSWRLLAGCLHGTPGMEAGCSQVAHFRPTAQVLLGLPCWALCIALFQLHPEEGKYEYLLPWQRAGAFPGRMCDTNSEILGYPAAGILRSQEISLGLQWADQYPTALLSCRTRGLEFWLLPCTEAADSCPNHRCSVSVGLYWVIV